LKKLVNKTKLSFILLFLLSLSLTSLKIAKADVRQFVEEESLGVVSPDMDYDLWFPQYDNDPARHQSFIGISNYSGNTISPVYLFVGAGSETKRYDLSVAPYVTVFLTNLTDALGRSVTGSIHISSPNGKLFASQRTHYRYNDELLDENMAVAQADLDRDIWFTWYDNYHFDTKLLITNPTASSINVRFWVGAGSNARYYTSTIGPWKTNVYSNLSDLTGANQTGTVHVQADVGILASMRVYGKGTGVLLSEENGLGQSELSTLARMPFYDNNDFDTYLAVGNPNPNTNNVNWYIGSNSGSVSIPPWATTFIPRPQSYRGGPVRLVSSSNLPIVASKREHQKGNVTLLDETYLASPSNDYETVRFPWFNGSEFDDWLMIYNPTSNDITVEVYIGGTSPIQTTTVNANSRKELWYHNVGGRVMVKNITNTDDIIVSKRTKHGFIPDSTKWSVNQVPYYIHYTIPVDWFPFIDAAASTWSNTGAKISFFNSTNSPKGYFEYTVPSNENWLAETQFNGSYAITRLNPLKPWSTSGAGNAFDVQNVATHEFGHWLKLVDQYYLGIDEDKTLYGVVTQGETKKRSLFNTDKMGARYMYGK